MTRYILRRVATSALSLWALVSVVFFASRLLGDVSTTLLPMDASAEEIERLNAHYGLDRPLLHQYALFLGRGITGDFGTAFSWGRPVTELIAGRLPASLQLLAGALVVAIVLSIVPGVYAAVRQDSKFDLVARTGAVLGGSMPSFWVGIVAIMLFSVTFPIFPSGGRDGLVSLVLPAFTLGWALSGSILRLTRSSMLEELDADYVTLARMKGLPAAVVHWRHAARNAALPVITYIGVLTARLLGATVVVETVFSWPGLGRLLIQAVNARDFPVIQGLVFALGLFIITVNIVVDLLYFALSPRLRAGLRTAASAAS